MLATIGHELRAPLTSIRGYVETLLDGEYDATTARRFLETVRREALRLGRLVDGMLEFSPLDLSTREFVRSDVGEQVLATIEMLSPMAVERGVTIRTRWPGRICARIDGDACFHALANLVENAVKHGAVDGTVQISCASESPYVSILIDDDGDGVPPELRETIFTMGVRGENAGSGCGIGLAIVKAIAERAGGYVGVAASPLGGARFVLHLLEG
jgi:signal transduction histidine kinase